jgi:hypothetical protein
MAKKIANRRRGLIIDSICERQRRAYRNTRSGVYGSVVRQCDALTVNFYGLIKVRYKDCNGRSRVTWWSPENMIKA